MYEEFAWEHFLSTGDIQTFIEYKKMREISSKIYEKKGEIADETCKSKGDSDKRSRI